MEQVYVNRELSWLKFNERVLEEAARPEVPLCERLNFLSIYQTNLDEFFMVRVGSLVDQMSLNRKLRDNKTNMTAQEQYIAVLEDVRRLSRRKEEVYISLMRELENYGVRIVDFHKISPEESHRLERYFDEKVALLLSPVIVGKRQPFPFMRNQEIYAVAALRKKNDKKRKIKLGIISCSPNVLPRLIRVSEQENTFMLAEELILHCINRVFKNYVVESKSLVRLTRNGDMDTDSLYDEDLDYRDFMSEVMKQRKRQAPVRMEMSREMGMDLVATLCDEMDVSRNAVFRTTTPLDLTFLNELSEYLHGHSELFYPHRSPQRPDTLTYDRPILDQIEESDKLLCYPFDSMQPFLRMLHEAANDPKVISIKMTLYRVAKQSQVVDSLVEAAENGKDVQVLLELKARFDEENNIARSHQLEEAGCQVIYGLNGYKVHSKLCLIVRQTDNGPHYITQIGTGNYNEKTAKLYTDDSILTANQQIGQNVAAIFQSLAMGETMEQSDILMVAPKCLQNRILDLIQREIEQARAGNEAYIGFKINSLTDKAIMDKLIDASRAGVKIDLIIRGICCLVPGIPGKTENIRVISIVGRLLEHSRIYIFGTGAREELYISSADLMTRNTLRRVEVATPVLDENIRQQIRFMFNTMLQDNCQAWELQSNGIYRRIPQEGTPINSQEMFYQIAYDRAAGRKNNPNSAGSGSGTAPQEGGTASASEPQPASQGTAGSESNPTPLPESSHI